MTEESLKPCPLCNESVELIMRGNEFTKSRTSEIYCKNCHLKIIVGAIRFTHQWTKENVSEKWNNAWAWKEIERLKEALSKEREKVVSDIIRIIDNYPDITVDDSVRIKNEIYDLIPSPATEDSKK